MTDQEIDRRFEEARLRVYNHIDYMASRLMINEYFRKGLMLVETGFKNKTITQFLNSDYTTAKSGSGDFDWNSIPNLRDPFIE